MMSDANKLNEIIVKIPLLPPNDRIFGLQGHKRSLDMQRFEKRVGGKIMRNLENIVLLRHLYLNGYPPFMARVVQWVGWLVLHIRGCWFDPRTCPVVCLASKSRCLGWAIPKLVLSSLLRGRHVSFPKLHYKS